MQNIRLNTGLLLCAKILPLICLAVSLGATAQATFSHFDQIRLNQNTAQTKNMHKTGATDPAEPEVTILMRVADKATIDRLRATGAEILQVEGPIVVLKAAARRAEDLAATEGVISVSLNSELDRMEYQNNLGIDLSRTVLGLDKAHTAAAPLTEAYNGKDVVIGVVDQGLDAQHLSFLDKDGNTRVKRVFFTLSNNSQVDLKTPAHVKNWKGDITTTTHGTHVTGIAAGSVLADNGADAPDLTGAAPEADIMLGATQGSMSNDFMLRAVRQIVDAAKTEGKPCVINLSLGNNNGPMDGTDEASVALSEIAAESGAIICVAAGNEGDANATIHHTFSGSTPLKTFIESSPYTGFLWPSSIALYARAIGRFQIWSEDDTPVKVTFQLVKTDDPHTPFSSFTIEGENPAYIATKNGSSSTGVDDKYICTDDEYFNSTLTGSFIGGQARVEPSNNRYHIECRTQLQFSTDANDRTHGIVIQIEGTPGKQVFIYANTMSGVFPMNFASRNAEGFTAPNGDGTLNTMACAHNIITVGSYNSHSFPTQGTGAGKGINQTSYFSSWARLLDGRHLPHICAPGMNIVSSMSRHYANGAYYNPGTEPKYYTRTHNGTTYYWTPMTGTSMATPFMAGVAAMWLSADPTLTTDDIIRIAQETSWEPDMASDNKGASGNLNAFEGLCKILGLSSVSNITVDNATDIAITHTNGQCRILAPGTDHIDITIHDMSGRTVTTTTAQGNTAAVSTASLTPGIYLITASTTGARKTIKINI